MLPEKSTADPTNDASTTTTTAKITTISSTTTETEKPEGEFS